MLELRDLDERTRALMQVEVDYDLAHHQLYLSPLLSAQGQRDYLGLLRTAIATGTPGWLAENLRYRRRLMRTMPRYKPTGSYVVSRRPVTAAERLAEDEFNRYYIRAICRRALEDRIDFLVVYQARPAVNPDPESAPAGETILSPKALLDEVRAHPGESIYLQMPAGLNPGLSVQLPHTERIDPSHD